MSLPDCSRLTALKPRELIALGDRLRALGVTREAAQPLFAAGGALPPMLRPVVRKLRARAVRTAVGVAMRALLFDDPVPLDDARATFGDDLARFLDVGLLVAHEDRVVAPFVLGIVDDLYILADVLTAGADAVMGLGPTTMLLATAASGGRKARRVLEIGCGAGTVALVLARSAEQVVATDVNPRALALARINAALNGLTNVDVREGSLFEPVRGETFDLVVSQPPFVARPAAASALTFLHGGARGDELSRALLEALPAHLAPGGRAVVLAEWPDVGEPVETTVRRLIGEPANAMILAAPSADLDTHCALYAAGLHPRLDRAFEGEVVAQRAHFEALGVRAIVPTLTVVEAAPREGASPSWTATVPVVPFASLAIDGARIGRMLEARRLAADLPRLRATRLRVPEGAIIAQEQRGPGAERESRLSVRFPGNVGLQSVDLTESLLFLLTHVHEAPSAEAGAAAFLASMDDSSPESLARALASVAEALRYGLLQVD